MSDRQENYAKWDTVLKLLQILRPKRTVVCLLCLSIMWSCFFFFFFLMNLPSCTRCQRNISNNLKVESFFIWWECLGPQDGGRGNSISVALRKLLQGGRKGSQAVYKFATKGAVSLNIKDQISS